MKPIIKLNENNNYLSLGNIFRIIKESSIDSSSFIQSELFSVIFNCDYIANSTVNNYLTGQRAINSKYKNYILKKLHEYNNDKKAFISIVSAITSLINTSKFDDKQYRISEINNDSKFKLLCYELYSIAKNDEGINIKLSNKLYTYYKENKLYEFFIEVLTYAVLNRKQPLYKEKIINETIENDIINTNISVNDIEKFIKLQLKEGIWSLRGISELAKNNNPYACFELASLEFYGIISGKPRYNKAYEYYKIADENNHPVASWAIGYLFYNKYIGNRTEEELTTAYEYFNKSISNNCPSAYNSMGLVYLNGDIPGIEKDIKKSIEYFKKGAEQGNIYALNNLGKIEESNNNYTKAFKYFEQSANYGDSWAANKVGEYYRNGIGIKKDLLEAYNYYKLSSESSILSLCPWSKYNLAKYYYKYGVPNIDIKKNLNKAIELLEEVSDSLIEATEELIYIYYELYKENNCKEEYKNPLNNYISLIEKSLKFTPIIKKRIEKNISQIFKSNLSLNIDKYI